MIANLSLDLDNLWAYQRTAEIDGWQEFPSYLSLVIPRVINHLAISDLPITAFVVGRDLLDSSNVGAIKQFLHAGHDVANHSFEHEPWLHQFDRSRLEKEIVDTGTLIESELGVKPIGFRGPGYSDSPLVHQILRENGYHYVASSFPSCVGPLARTFYLLKTGWSKKRKASRKKMFGSFSDLFNKNHPYPVESTDPQFWMMPVTVQPITRIPFHFTYLFYLSQFSPAVARMHFRMSLALCRFLKVAPSLLLHPLDFLTSYEEPSLAFFPGMRLSLDAKKQQMRWFLDYLAMRFDVVSMNQHYRILSGETQYEPSKSRIERFRTRPNA